MVKNKIWLIMLLLPFLLVACNKNKNANYNENIPDTTQTTKKIDFVMQAASGGMMEVQLGKLASQKGVSKDVKKFGMMMITDHTKANNELKTIAKKLKILLSNSLLPDDQDKVDKLKGLSGKDFDKEYVDMMIEDHKGDIDLFKDASINDLRPEIKQFALKTLPVLQKHLEKIQQIKK